MPRMATTRALSRAASRNAAVVISDISRNVGIGRKQKRREEAAQYDKDGDDKGVEQRGKKKRGGRDERHQQECRDRPKEIKMVNRAAREGDGIQNHDAGRAQGLRERGEIFARHHHAANKQAEAGEKTNGHAQLRRGEVVVKRVFDEKRDTEKQREPAEPGEAFDAHELFPINFWQRRFRWCQRTQWRDGRRKGNFDLDRKSTRLNSSHLGISY